MSGVGVFLRESERIWKVTNSSFASNTYIHSTEQLGECFLVDPGLDGPAIEVALKELGLRPRYAFCTHGHFDHVGSAAFFQHRYDIPIFLHAADLATAKASNFLLMAFKVAQRIEMPRFEIVSDNNFMMTIDDRELRYHSTPGHTPGSCVIRFGDAVFTGDTLYSRGMGLSKLPGENSNQLRESLRESWDLFPAESVAYPGHGKSASFAWIKANNRKLLQFIRGTVGNDSEAHP